MKSHKPQLYCLQTQPEPHRRKSTRQVWPTSGPDLLKSEADPLLRLHLSGIDCGNHMLNREPIFIFKTHIIHLFICIFIDPSKSPVMELFYDVYGSYYRRFPKKKERIIINIPPQDKIITLHRI